ncbi:uncharacterized protein isoform X1 [Musca autumnalis]|uniref:uncharacterized protein isoform X1 n=2 Tax=Musca autumnalis TaxID=221902 RepID=UPI003CECE814
MLRRSQRLQKKMSQGNENTKKPLPAEVTASASSSESELEKTIVEQQQNTAGENIESLEEEIRALKSSLQMYINAANTTTSVAVSQPPTFHHNVVAAPSTTMYYSVASMPSRTMDVPYTPTTQKLSIDHQHMFSQNINSAQYITPLFPQPLVQQQTYCPPSYAPTQQQLHYVPFFTPQSASYNLPPSLLSEAPMVSYPSYATHLFSGVPNATSNDQPSQRLTVSPSTIIKTSTQPNVVLQSQQNNFSDKANNCVPLLQQSQQQNTTIPSTYSEPQTSTFAATQSAGNVNNCLLQVPQQIMQTSMQNSIRKLHDLPEFNGQPEQWPMFAVSYKETTRMYNYTKLENLTRLQKALKGEAKAKVEAYLIHPECVDQVMSTLEFHFGRPQIMIRSQIAKVRSFPTISGATPHLCNLTLLEELVNKLPLSKREEWARFSLNNLGQYPTIRQFSTWLQEVATYVSFATEADSTKADFMQNKNAKVKQSFAITTDVNRKNLCVVCGEKHLIYYCSKFKNFSTADRWKVVKEKRLCFTCLKADHISQKCNNRQQCSVCGCQKYHNRLLHEAGKNNNNIIGNNNMGNSENATSSVTTIVDEYTNKKTLFKYLPVRLRGPKGYINIIAFINDGSKISLLEEKVAKQIGLSGPYSNLSLGWIGGKKSSEMSMRIDVEIASKNGEYLQMRNVRTTNHLKLPKQSLNIADFKKRFSILENIFIDDYFDVTPKLLIGLPHIRLVRPQNVMDLDENFSVHQTLLGNIVFGSNEESADNMVCVIDVSDYNDIQKQVAEYFSIEGFGMKPVLPVESEEDKRAEAILKNTTVKIGNQYETGLLWRKDDYAFKDTYSVALRRLQGIETKMKKDESLAKWYNEKIDEYVSKGYARKLNADEASIVNERTWYLPHFVVTNVNKNSKRRLVFDAAANIDGESFNSRLMKGPCKYQPKPLLSILFKFRQGTIGICGDIREMFHRVKIRDQDQTAQRFLWRGGDSTRAPDIYIMSAMIFGSACSPCSAQYVKNLNAENYFDSEPRAYKAIVDCHYVDDFVDSFDTMAEALSVTRSVIRIHKEANFELRGFISNSVDLLESLVPDGDENKMDFKNFCVGESTGEKVLGLFWLPKTDSFYFNLKFSKLSSAVRDGERIPTKSEVLSVTMSIFDPFGFIANIVIRSKLILQELWRFNIDWNAPIPTEIYRRWYEWFTELQNVKYIEIPRCYAANFTSPDTKIELHVFVDASEVAFSAVCYWRITGGDQVEIKFVAGKVKCAPLRPLSIPRLELQSAVLGVRLKEAIVASHDIKPNKITFWSDSKTVVRWIQSDCRIYKQFVSHRVAEILEYSKVEEWRWIPGSQNPADDATRPCQFSGKVSRWLKGPDFLKMDPVNWPLLPEDIKQFEKDPEIRTKFIATTTVSDCLFPYDEKTKYYSLLRKTAWLYRAINNFKRSISFGGETSLNLKPYLIPQEIKNAEIYWCKRAQEEEFKNEILALKMGRRISKKSPIFELNPCLGDDGLIRISGRINNATCVGPSTRKPIIMPKNNLITKLIVKQYHEDFLHQNQESICAAIRTKFWIPSLRQLVRSSKKNCQICKNRSAVPRPPLMGQLPEDRVIPFVRAFSYTGVDFIGPYTVSLGRRSEKRWVALFTCLTTRAIHLELAKDLSTDAVILCLRNFINRRGVPVRIRSDRGTNFIGASKENFVFDSCKIGDECTRRGIEWVFNNPADPSAGGAWERMVRAVKNVLAFTLKEKSPQVETLNSLLIEAENLVNSRPLTHLPIESEDSEPLTPNHFLVGGPNFIQTPTVNENICLRKQWHILQQMKQTFWKRWIQEYLPDLVRRTKWFHPVPPIKVGDVVVVCDSNVARGEWKRGVVVEVCTAADGQVRSAVVKTSAGKLRRPASKLAVLDVSGESPDRFTGGGML